MESIKQATGIVKTAAARFQWTGKVRYQNRSYTGDVLASCWDEALFEFLTDALTEWFGQTDNEKWKLLYEYTADHPNWFRLKLKDSLDTVITRYALSKKYNDPIIAMNQCIIASKRLKKFIEGLGFKAEAITLQGPREQLPEATSKWRKVSSDYWKHHVVAVDNRVYDLTFRQFDPNCPYPLITTLVELKKKWKEIYLEELGD